MVCTLLADIYKHVDSFFFVYMMVIMINNKLLQLKYVHIVHYTDIVLWNEIITITIFINNVIMLKLFTRHTFHFIVYHHMNMFQYWMCYSLVVDWVADVPFLKYRNHVCQHNIILHLIIPYKSVVIMVINMGVKNGWWLFWKMVHLCFLFGHVSTSSIYINN